MSWLPEPSTPQSDMCNCTRGCMPAGMKPVVSQYRTTRQEELLYQYRLLMVEDHQVASSSVFVLACTHAQLALGITGPGTAGMVHALGGEPGIKVPCFWLWVEGDVGCSGVAVRPPFWPAG
jgi:hypothetical protein